MTATVTLPSGGTAEILTSDELRARHRRAFQAHMGAATTLNDDGTPNRDAVFAVSAGLSSWVAALVVVDWHLPYAPGTPIPARTPRTPDDPRGEAWEDVLHFDDMIALEKATVGYMTRLSGNGTGREPEVDDRGRPVEGSPTQPGTDAGPDSPDTTSPQPATPSIVAGTTP